MNAATPTTTALVTALWAETFARPVSEVDTTEGFFEAGGTSYRALALMHRIEETFGLEIPLVTILAEGTVDFLAQEIDDRRGEALLAELHGLSDDEAARLLGAEDREGA
ncbi:acyl carrier protein [Streptomyces californicus]|uniref:acyl carrier protein n=1 Tax=Streptomyces californicus TaxID=67351 RepID=UPI0037897075